MLGKTEVHMRSPESVSSALLKVAIGLPRASVMYVFGSMTSPHHRLAHLLPRSSCFITRNGSPLRTRMARETGRFSVVMQVTNAVQPNSHFFKVMDSLHETGTHT